MPRPAPRSPPTASCRQGRGALRSGPAPRPRAPARVGLHGRLPKGRRAVDERSTGGHRDEDEWTLAAVGGWGEAEAEGEAMHADIEGFASRSGGRARSWLALLAALLLIVGLAACGEEVAEEPAPEPEEEPEPEEDPETEEEPAAEGWVESLVGDFWYEGAHVELLEAELVVDDTYSEPEGMLSVRGEFTNLTDDTYRGSLFPFDDMILVVDGAQIIATGYASELPDLPEGGRNVGEIAFAVEPDLELAGVELHAGPPAKQHTIIALDGSAEPEGFEPIEVDLSGDMAAGDLLVEVSAGDLWPFSHDRFEQLDDGALSLGLTVDLAYEGDRYSRHMDREFVLELPDGRTVMPELAPADTLQPNELVTDEPVAFLVEDPPEGAYELTVTTAEDDTAAFDFEL